MNYFPLSWLFLTCRFYLNHVIHCHFPWQWGQGRWPDTTPATIPTAQEKVILYPDSWEPGMTCLCKYPSSRVTTVNSRGQGLGVSEAEMRSDHLHSRIKSGVYSQSGCSCGSQWCLVFWYSKWELRCWHCWALKSSKCFWHSSVLQSWYSKLTPGQSWPPLMGLEKGQHFKGWLAGAQQLRLTDAVLLAKSQHVWAASTSKLPAQAECLLPVSSVSKYTLLSPPRDEDPQTQPNSNGMFHSCQKYTKMESKHVTWANDISYLIWTMQVQLKGWVHSPVSLLPPLSKAKRNGFPSKEAVRT